MLGPSLTASTGAVSAITNAEGMAELACTGLGPKIELTYKTLYHLLPPQLLNARAMLEYATKVLKAKRVGVLHDTGYGQVVMNSLNSLTGEYGVEFVSVEKFEVGATDTSAQAAKVRAARSRGSLHYCDLPRSVPQCPRSKNHPADRFGDWFQFI